MSLTGKQLRDVERAFHIAAGVILMWQHARVTRLIRGAKGAPQRARTEGR
jgi:hypothetical protein